MNDVSQNAPNGLSSVVGAIILIVDYSRVDYSRSTLFLAKRSFMYSRQNNIHQKAVVLHVSGIFQRIIQQV